ncbi:alpha/beta hydrolase [Muricauda sp. 2012CJ35-5]|uniref:Alpha/beta hydrolase n=1 Tax=Flagellimonas spongiicola TaxID=2942208 RepID=A0ABT0PUT2_9FLAO|nr:alpha/beta hydrolase [Allomuricauda spongiicola]MCL6275110.1 alpha/beta hydrolase [Allomuricauda spongiicola]
MKKVLGVVSIAILFVSCQKNQKNGVEANAESVQNSINIKKENTMENLKSGKNTVTFKSFGVDLVGDLYLPEGFDPNKKYKAIVGASPFPQVKEQIPATYGPEMANRGFIYLGFDYLGMGDSPALPGEFKQSRYMFRLIENTWDAVSYLGTLPFVEEIYGLGVCQGGSIIASAAVTDHRIKKIATVSGMMAADAFQWTDKNVANQTIAAANASMQKQYETGEPDYVAPFGLTDEQSREEFVGTAAVPEMAGESYDYYGRDGFRGPKAVENYTNMHIGDQAMQSLISIGEAYADKIAQPTLVVYGKNAPTAICSTAFIDKLTNEHEVVALEEFSHVDFYYKPDAVKVSTDAVADFFNK